MVDVDISTLPPNTKGVVYLNKTHRVVTTAVGGRYSRLYRYYPQFKRGGWQYYKDPKLPGAYWTATAPAAHLFINRKIGFIEGASHAQ